LYENLAVLPRAFVVAQAQFVADTWDGTEAALRLMRDPAFDPTQTVILAGNGVDSDVATTTSESPVIMTVSYADTEAQFTVEAPNGGYLLLTDAYYPGWQATINGETVPLYRADVMFRAVALKPGNNEVRFTYAPDWLAWVFPVSGIAWLAVIGVTGSWVFHRRRG
ncbi:MAG: YfhO family protein, partial [Anaerolineae bacterium]|nr:YfhO family protein [Anaerolineae bacterium]